MQAPLATPLTDAVPQAVSQAMTQLDMPALLALAGALGWASGFRLYAVVFMVGASGALGWLTLPEGLHVLQHPAMLVVSGLMLTLEFFADKVPGIDSLWDAIHAVLRVPAGAALAAGVFGLDGGTMTWVAALLGGGLAATSQAAKTTTRAAINTSPEPFSNVAASLFEDGLVIGIVWLATHHPFAFGALLLVAVLLMWLVVWWLFRFLGAAWRRVANMFSAPCRSMEGAK